MVKESSLDPTPDFTRFIDTVIERVKVCDKHPISARGSHPGPCYELPIDTTIAVDRPLNWGVCDIRARKAGFIGEPSPPPKPRTNTQWNRSQTAS